MKVHHIIFLAIVLTVTGIFIGNLAYYYEPADDEIFIDLFKRINEAKKQGNIEEFIALESPKRAGYLQNEIKKNPELRDTLRTLFMKNALVKYKIDKIERKYFEKAYVVSFTGKNTSGEQRQGKIVFGFYNDTWRMSD